MLIIFKSPLSNRFFSVEPFSSIMSWILISFCLCIYGILKEFRPSESYVIPYLKGPRMNFTEEQVRIIIFDYLQIQRIFNICLLPI